MAADKKRGAQAVRDMVLSLVVIILAAGVIYLFVPHDEDDKSNPAVKTVGYGVELKSARRAAPYPVAAPVGLPKEWRATSVHYTADGPKGAAWHLGFMTPDNEYAAVEQGDGPRRTAYIEEVTQGARKTSATQRVGDEEWERWKGDKYDALVRPAGAESADGGDGGDDSRGGKDGDEGAAGGSREARHPVTVVTGTATFDQLATLAESLEAKRETVQTDTGRS
ncbi:DUF4245 domain-containing protein [Streptomyces cacaoi]|uniref:DUF4245 domain-containing protein n=1 Tax=Streptomyces cacaoi TaxID=1898 RepID=A0A4Y3R5N1_STRCI|nr:DUF4245 domain-containing protein [Streptomyces cacaoi]GEB52103.1 hypothetical protein SCA03_46540 [Streptomyces cacaoi]